MFVIPDMARSGIRLNGIGNDVLFVLRSMRKTPGFAATALLTLDESLAKRYWPNRDAIGRRFKGQDRRGRDDDWITVIGVVRDARREGVERESTPHVFLWHRQSEPTTDWVIRPAPQPAHLAASVRAVVREIDPRAVVADMMPMEQQIELQTTERRFQTWLLTTFAALALVLAAVGIFGVMSHSAARRRSAFEWRWEPTGPASFECS